MIIHDSSCAFLNDEKYEFAASELWRIFAVLYFGLLAALGSGVWYTLQILGTYRPSTSVAVTSLVLGLHSVIYQTQGFNCLKQLGEYLTQTSFRGFKEVFLFLDIRFM